MTTCQQNRNTLWFNWGLYLDLLQMVGTSTINNTFKKVIKWWLAILEGKASPETNPSLKLYKTQMPTVKNHHAGIKAQMNLIKHMTTGWTFWHSLYDFVNVYWDASPSNSEKWEMWEFTCIPQVNISDCVIILVWEHPPYYPCEKKLSGRLIKLSKKSFDKGMGLLPSLNLTPAPENRPSPQKK